MNDTEGSQMNDKNHIERLRCILECQQSRTVTIEEASDIGESLIAFFETLGDESETMKSEANAESMALAKG